MYIYILYIELVWCWQIQAHLQYHWCQSRKTETQEQNPETPENAGRVGDISLFRTFVGADHRLRRDSTVLTTIGSQPPPLLLSSLPSAILLLYGCDWHPASPPLSLSHTLNHSLTPSLAPSLSPSFSLSLCYCASAYSYSRGRQPTSSIRRLFNLLSSATTSINKIIVTQDEHRLTLTSLVKCACAWTHPLVVYCVLVSVSDRRVHHGMELKRWLNCRGAATIGRKGDPVKGQGTSYFVV